MSVEGTLAPVAQVLSPSAVWHEPLRRSASHTKSQPALHFLPDIARGLVTLAERREADGEVWHLPAAPPLTAQQFLDPILEAAGRPTPAKPRRSRSDARDRRTLLAAHAGLRETTYQFHAPFVADSSKFERAFDPFDATSHHEAIEHSAQWFRSRGG